MINAFVIAAVVLVAALFPVAYVLLRGSPISAVVALELAGILTTLVIVCYAVGTQSTSASGVAILTAVLTWLSGLVYVRLMGRQK